MLKKLSGYLLLSVFSFGFFTLAFHAVAHAQTINKPSLEQPTTAPTPTTITAQKPNLHDTTPQLSPTPTIFVFVSITPTSSPLSNPTASPKKSTTHSHSLTATPPSTVTTAPTTSPTPLPISPAIHEGMDAEKLFAMSNAHRQSKGLPLLQKDERTCSLAVSRATEIEGELNAGTLHNGLQTRNLPYWNTENAIAIAPEEAAFNWWLNDPIHKQAIEGNHTYSCVACSGKYCVQEFTSYQPK